MNPILSLALRKPHWKIKCVYRPINNEVVTSICAASNSTSDDSELVSVSFSVPLTITKFNLHDEYESALDLAEQQIEEQLEELHNKPTQNASNQEIRDDKPSTGWILAEDRLPDIGVDVLVLARKNWITAPIDDLSYTVAYYDYHASRWRNSIGAVITVTHWHPLPEPPDLPDNTLIHEKQE